MRGSIWSPTPRVHERRDNGGGSVQAGFLCHSSTTPSNVILGATPMTGAATRRMATAECPRELAAESA